jgi:hypothetical protein
MTVRQLTEQQATLLQGQIWGFQGQEFNPQQDANNVWFISNEEINGCTLVQAQAIGCESWLTNLPEIDYVPKEITR